MTNEKQFIRPEAGDISTETMGWPIVAKRHNLAEGWRD